MCVANDHIYFPFVVPKDLSSPGLCSCLSGSRVVHVVHAIILYDVISCNVRYNVRAKTTFESSRLSILLFVG
jgi:hypothetical protein